MYARLLFAIGLLLCLGVGWLSPVHCQTLDWADMSLEELLDVKVVSYNKTTERMLDVATSIYVITEEDIRRSGATRLTELLNLVPGAWFQEFTYSFTVNGIRTQADEFPQSVLVLLDGVALQTSITGGPMFNYVEIPVNQIERIEVIKGPGGTVYGANANTGIISIYTKTARQSEGLLVTLDGGSQDLFSPFVRYGARISEGAHLSGFLSYLTTRGYDKTDRFSGDFVDLPAGLPDVQVTNPFTSNETDGREAISGGLNLDIESSSRLKSSTRLFFSDVSSDVYTDSLQRPVPWIAKDGGTEIIVSERLDFTMSDTHALFASVFVRDQQADVATDGGYQPGVSVIDFELQDDIQLRNHGLTFGANLRFVNFDIHNNPQADIQYWRPDAKERLYSIYVQDKIGIGDKVDLTMGVKAETWTLISNEPELSPSIRLAIKARPELTFWAAVSRSVTTPGFFHSNLEQRFYDLGPDLGLPPGSLYIGLVPGESIKPTEYVTCELGLRSAPSQRFFFDISTFYADYDNAFALDDDFASKEPVASYIGDYLVLPLYFANIHRGKMYGGEAVAVVMPNQHLKMELSYSLNEITMVGLPIPSQPGATYTAPKVSPPRTPKHVVRFRSILELPKLDLDIWLNATWSSKSYRGQPYNYLALTADDENGIYVDPPESLLKLDLNIEKRFHNDRFAFNIWGRNILSDDYVEFYSEYVSAGYPHTVHRTFGGRFRVSF